MLRSILQRLIGDASPTDRTPDSALTITDNVVMRVADTDSLRDRYPDWDALSRRERWLATLDPGRATELGLDLEGRALTLAQSRPPGDVVRASNTTCAGLHDHIVDELDPGQTVNKTASHLAVGNDDATAPSSGDTALNNEVYRTAVTDHADNGNDLLCSTFLDSTEANGYTIKEVGLFTASTGGSLLNHSLISNVAKDNTKTVTIDVTLQFRAA